MKVSIWSIYNEKKVSNNYFSHLKNKQSQHSKQQLKLTDTNAITTHENHVKKILSNTSHSSSTIRNSSTKHLRLIPSKHLHLSVDSPLLEHEFHRGKSTFARFAAIILLYTAKVAYLYMNFFLTEFTAVYIHVRYLLSYSSASKNAHR